jgi:hypothetical protein
MRRILIKYYDPRILTKNVNLNELIGLIMQHFGDNVLIEFQIMSFEEKAHVVKTVMGIDLIQQRFWIFELLEDGSPTRRTDLEEKIPPAYVK